jgi:hypothetical protein
MDREKSRPGVEKLTLADFERLGKDKHNYLYWDDEPLLTESILRLSRRQEKGAIIIAIVALLGALGSITQGITAYDTLACQMHWSFSYCSAAIPLASAKNP